MLTSQVDTHGSIRSGVVTRLFQDQAAGYLWLFVRLYIGWTWLASGWRKIYGESSIGWIRDGEVGGRFVHGGDRILGFWNRAVQPPREGAMPAVAYDWYRDFLQYMIDHRWNGWFAYVIAFGEFLVGLGLILGAFTALAAFFGASMNFSYMLAGSASTNPVLFLGSVLLILAWKTAGYIGLDRWILPLMAVLWRRLTARVDEGGVRERPRQRLIRRPNLRLGDTGRHQRSA